MKVNDEAAALAVLGVSQWSDLTLEHVPQLAQLIPAMDRELALSILPKLSTDALAGAFSTLQAVLSENGKSQDRLHEYDMKTHEFLACAMGQADSPEERAEVRADYRMARQEKYAKDTENKTFWAGLAKTALGFSFAIVVTSLFAARANGRIEAA
jgi:hypothetical protein